MDLIILNLGQITRTTPEIAPPLQASAPHQREGILPLRIERASAPLTRRFFGGIRFRAWYPTAPSSNLPPGNRGFSNTVKLRLAYVWIQKIEKKQEK
ncbi:hypothetical protein AVEN_195343-1 [Araneus ventricosus]|uniref:Uncharacterized protein n=1 Tax=Araneus ventricosus TaxID=182803 RepID=A0A4Y2V246_ARAVE|nr:hypothetical protein AVEN_195343-1 [Araneus ventricosus]